MTELSGITLKFQKRADGGLRVWSDDIPNLIVDGPDAKLVLYDLGLALAERLVPMWSDGSLPIIEGIAV